MDPGAALTPTPLPGGEGLFDGLWRVPSPPVEGWGAGGFGYAGAAWYRMEYRRSRMVNALMAAGNSIAAAIMKDRT